MSSDLSFSAIRRIIFLVENDDRPADRTKKGRTAKPTWPLSIRFTLQQVSNKWWTVYELYRGIKPAPPLDYLHSLELALVHKGKVDDEDVRAIFAHPKPLEFWGCPRQLVSKIVDVRDATLSTNTESFSGVRRAAEQTGIPRRDNHCA